MKERQNTTKYENNPFKAMRTLQDMITVSAYTKYNQKKIFQNQNTKQY